MTFGQTITWGRESVTVEGCASREEAERAVVQMAKKAGWPGPRRWWQFWRRGEPNLSHLAKYF